MHFRESDAPKREISGEYFEGSTANAESQDHPQLFRAPTGSEDLRYSERRVARAYRGRKDIQDGERSGEEPLGAHEAG